MNKQKYLENLSEKLTAGHIDRRKFMMSAIATGVAVPTAMSMASQALAATPKKGGLFRMGLGHGSTTDTLDSGTSENHFTLVNGYTFGNHLTEVEHSNCKGWHWMVKFIWMQQCILHHV